MAEHARMNKYCYCIAHPWELVGDLQLSQGTPGMASWRRVSQSCTYTCLAEEG